MHKECIMTFNHISHTGPARPVRPSPSSSRRSGPAVPTPVAVFRWTLLRCQFLEDRCSGGSHSGNPSPGVSCYCYYGDRDNKNVDYLA